MGLEELESVISVRNGTASGFNSKDATMVNYTTPDGEKITVQKAISDIKQNIADLSDVENIASKIQTSNCTINDARKYGKMIHIVVTIPTSTPSGGASFTITDNSLLPVSSAERTATMRNAPHGTMAYVGNGTFTYFCEAAYGNEQWASFTYIAKQ